MSMYHIINGKFVLSNDFITSLSSVLLSYKDTLRTLLKRSFLIGHKVVYLTVLKS